MVVLPYRYCNTNLSGGFHLSGALPLSGLQAVKLTRHLQTYYS